MRRTLVKNGLMQRINSILGTGSSPTSLTDWSIQASMITNLQRIVSALVGDAKGRPMKGLLMTKEGWDLISISSGLGMTRNGDIIVLESSIKFSPSDSGVTNGKVYVYLKHSLAYDTIDGKSSPMSGGAPDQELVVDDLAASKHSTVGDFSSEVMFLDTDNNASLGNLVYLGTVQIIDGEAESPVNYGQRGLLGGGMTDEVDVTSTPKLTVVNGLITDASA
jgi:hypothetical protein